MRHRLALLVLLAGVGCQLSPDSKSGDDRFRHLSKPIAFGEWEMDELSYPLSDRTDWKKVEIPEEGDVRIELQCENADAGVLVALYDLYGRLIDKVLKIPGDSRPLVVSQSVTPGRYFVMIQAAEDSDETKYSFKVSFE